MQNTSRQWTVGSRQQQPGAGGEGRGTEQPRNTSRQWTVGSRQEQPGAGGRRTRDGTAEEYK